MVCNPNMAACDGLAPGIVASYVLDTWSQGGCVFCFGMWIRTGDPLIIGVALRLWQYSVRIACGSKHTLLLKSLVAVFVLIAYGGIQVSLMLGFAKPNCLWQHSVYRFF